MSGSRQLMSSDVVASLKSNWVNNCGNMAACVLVLYDHLTTLSQEVEFIWGRQFSSVTLLYHLNRWTIFVWAVNGFIPGLATLSGYGA
ncbi:hypothetical protein CERSUDRAFT_92143 [Gelatoporia subvermispora B]|uniref:DUF6533 domain-containing protein n=1 Tax=Ceriporiopsis subvermispora (strain B) TaxID=914234 RepID=M2PSK4_CERS8|nr:hypothetical protein CERSUDRAFT_92143 [Gelatoporia subvermispora B]